jgi:excisionase family DNA binding protein
VHAAVCGPGPILRPAPTIDGSSRFDLECGVDITRIASRENSPTMRCVFGKISTMTQAPVPTDDDFSTMEAARRLGMAVRSVQLMVDRGELEAWRTPGGHRRIARASIERWLESRRTGGPAAPASAPSTAAAPTLPAGDGQQAVLVIEDSKHYQNLLQLLLRDHDAGLDIHIADDGIAGLALAGRLQPRLLIVDILLPGIDGATLIMGLRSHKEFASSRLIVVTSLDADELQPYRFALEGVTVIHKSRLVHDLPPRLGDVLGPRRPAAS